MTPVFHYMLTGRGFGSEINNLLFALQYAKDQSKPEPPVFVLNSQHWNAGVDRGWEDYFEPSPLWHSSLDSTRLRAVNGLIFLAVKGGLYLNDYPSVWDRNLSGKHVVFKSVLKTIAGRHIFLFFPLFGQAREAGRQQMMKDPVALKSSLHQFLLSLWRPKQTIQKEIEQSRIAGKYACLHIRRGDKIATGEDIHYAVSVYAERLKALKLSTPTVLVLCDDYRAFEELQDALPEYQLLTNTPSNVRGHDQRTFNRQPKEVIYQDTVRFIVDIELARNAQVFIGSHHSNVFRLVEYFKLKNCYSVAPDFRDIV
ncbi:hypothetical protein SAMN05444359_111122 [Neolewinella agarilytica]|uniref:Uncharacterized protein n=2 Tax=Neolewinella agarilytica TaxID=478744 RepID=A0A1H9GVG7_9BACT|nr:hypothetical protein SAMN05444359_111122 [Neolewinella agarilytica]